MKSLVAVLVSLLVLALALPTLASPTDGPIVPGDPATYQVLNPFAVAEAVSDLGGGVYQYSFAFTNGDASSGIWHFGVWTPFTPNSGPTGFSQKPGWLLGGPSDMGSVYSAYDATNLDPSITYLVNTWNTPPPWPQNSDLIEPGDYVSGFSFTSNTLYTGPVWWFSETLDSGWTQENGTNNLRAVGQTNYVPEPGTMVLLATGGLAALGGLKRRKKAAA